MSNTDRDYIRSLDRYDAAEANAQERALGEGQWDDPVDDDDPVCVCGVYRSEHRLCGCPEGFQTPESWANERAAIYAAVAYDDDPRGYGRYDDL